MTPIRLPVVLSPSRAELGIRCHRRHVLADILDRAAALRDKPSADFGTVMHAAVAEWWLLQGISIAERVPATMKVLRETWQLLRPTGDKHTLEMAEAMMMYYMHSMPFAAGLPGEWHFYCHYGTPVAEQRVEVELEDFVLSFKVDRLLENDNGELALIDLKTAARLDTRWHGGFDRWLQGKLYVYAVQKVIGRKIDYVIVEGLEKCVPTKHSYHPCPAWTDDQIEEAAMLLRKLAEQDAALLRTALASLGEEPVSEEDFQLQWREALEELALSETSFNYADCWAYNQPCPYLKLCNMAPAQRYGLLQSDYVIRPDDEEY